MSFPPGKIRFPRGQGEAWDEAAIKHYGIVVWDGSPRIVWVPEGHAKRWPQYTEEFLGDKDRLKGCGKEEGPLALLPGKEPLKRRRAHALELTVSHTGQVESPLA
jgi:hypothetical protein